MVAISPHPSVVSAVIDHVAVFGDRPGPTAIARRWKARTPGLTSVGASPAEIAAAARAASPERQDRIVGGLLAQPAGDEWAELTVLAAVAPHLRRVVARWARAGVTGTDLVDLEAELVTACWTYIRALMADGGDCPPPDRAALAVVDRAWQKTRDRRVRDRRRNAAYVLTSPQDLEEFDRDANNGPGGMFAALDQVAAVAARSSSLAPARALWLTSIAGYSTAEAAAVLHTTAGVVRVWRARAASRLMAV